MSHSDSGAPRARPCKSRPCHRPALAAALLAAALIPLPCTAAGLSYAEALDLARQTAPSLRAADAALAGATAALPAAATLPDPRLSAGLENVPVAGPDRWSVTRDTGTMQRLALMQEVPNRPKREARRLAAEARIERERAMVTQAALVVKRDAALAWLGAYHAGRRLALVAELRRENGLLQDTLPARIAAGQASPAELTMAKQEALAIDDRADELARDLRRARVALARWVGARADEPLTDPPVLAAVAADDARGGLHRHAELAPYGPMRDMAAAELAEADAERHGDWAWELAYSRRPRYDDMVSFQISLDLPWQRDRRQQPVVEARRQEVLRIEAERDELLRRHAEDVEAMLAEAAALDTQLARLQGAGLALAAERVALALASYEAGRGDLGAVLTARSQAVDIRLRAIELESRRDAVRVGLSTLAAE